MSVLSNDQLMMTDDGYNIQRSLRFRSSASAYLNRTPASASNRTTWTFSTWFKRGALSGQMLFNAGVSSTQFCGIQFVAANQIEFFDYSSGYNFQLTTSAVYRDPSAWYHLVAIFDSTQSTASNRVKIYINGTQVTAFATANYPSQNATFSVNNNVSHQIGRSAYSGSDYFDGYLAEVNFIDGQALTPSSFGQTDAVTGVWQPLKYTGTYGTNGFYLPFSDNTSATTLAYDKSGNGNNWTANNISTTAGATYDSMTDVPTLTSATAANYCVLNPLSLPQGGSISAGLDWTAPSATANAFGTQFVSTGKWYAEFVHVSTVGTVGFGAIREGVSGFNTATSGAYMYVSANGNKYDGTTNSAYGSTFTTGDVIGVAIDLDAGKIWFSKNGTWQASGDPATGANAAYTSLSGAHCFGIYDGTGSATPIISANFGQRPFSYTPPTGFKALNTFNLPDPTIKKPNQYMDATTYTGNGTGQSIVNSGSMQPDLVWAKIRSTVSSHALYDSSRGVRAGLFTNLTNAENTEAAGVSLTAFNANGFSLGTDNAGSGSVNFNAATYVAWQWKKGATPGFDIVTYTGNGANRTISHSLGVAPSMMIVKSRSQGTTGYTGNWAVWHSAIANTEYLLLNTTAAKATGATYWNSTTPTSSVFSLGTAAVVNNNNDNFVNYLFAEIAGFSKFGSYTGNGSTDGPFVYCGFRPRWVMIKRTDTAEAWTVVDTSRTTTNKNSVEYLIPNSSGAEFTDTNSEYDILSNGFKLRDTGSLSNGSGGTYIYAAFAEFPFRYSLAR